MRSVESASSLTRSAIRSETLARRSALTAPAGRWVASTRWTPSERPSAARRASDAGGVRDVLEHGPQLVHDHEQPRWGGRVGRVELAQVPHTRRGEEALAATHLGAQPDEQPRRSRRVEVAHVIDDVRQRGDGAEACPALEVDEQHRQPLGRLVEGARQDERDEQLGLARAGRAAHEQVGPVAGEVEPHGRAAGPRPTTGASEPAGCAPPGGDVPGGRRRDTVQATERDLVRNRRCGRPARRDRTAQLVLRHGCRRAGHVRIGVLHRRAPGRDVARSGKDEQQPVPGSRGATPPRDRGEVGRPVDDDDRVPRRGPGQLGRGRCRPPRPAPVLRRACADEEVGVRMGPDGTHGDLPGTSQSACPWTDHRERPVSPPGDREPDRRDRGLRRSCRARHDGREVVGLPMVGRDRRRRVTSPSPERAGRAGREGRQRDGERHRQEQGLPGDGGEGAGTDQRSDPAHGALATGFAGAGGSDGARRPGIVTACRRRRTQLEP